MILYHILSTLGALVVIPLFLLSTLLTGEKRRGLWHHFGFVPAIPESPGKKTLWVHALSLGEVTGAAPVLKIIHETRPDIRIAVSVTTDSGYDGARQKIPFAEAIFFHPFDSPPFTLTALRRIRPDALLVADTGFWPGLLDLLERRNIPALLFNGRISKRSLRRYQLLGPCSKYIFNGFSLLCMSSEDGRVSMETLGVEASRLQVIGDPKFDALETVSNADRSRLRQELKLFATNLVWIAGSTHAGEEEIILQVFKNLREKFPDLVLILAPRRLERLSEVESLLTAGEIPCIKKSAIDETGNAENQVILLDTMGELSKLYSLGDVAFVGHSLTPPGGGHSLVEPVAQGTIVLHGPYIENFRQVAEELKLLELAFSVSNAGEMETLLYSLLQDSSKRDGVTDKAAAWIQNHQGASRRMAERVLETLKE